MSSKIVDSRKLQHTQITPHVHSKTIGALESLLHPVCTNHLWIDVSQVQVSSGWVSNVMGTWRTIIQNCRNKKREEFPLVSDRARYFS